jgi:hypothetical protein
VSSIEVLSAGVRVLHVTDTSVNVTEECVSVTLALCVRLPLSVVNFSCLALCV